MRARNGETTYRDYGTPWSVVTRNLDVSARAHRQPLRRPRARSGAARSAIQSYVPFDVDMASHFTIDDGRLLFDRIDLRTEGTTTRLLGDASLSHWPEQMYRMQSTVDFPWMRKIFFANESFELSGKGEFLGTFHLFRDRAPDGRSRIGRELKGTFTSPVAGLNTLRFGDLKGAVKWVPESVQVSDTTMSFYGGAMQLGYTMGPFGLAGRAAHLLAAGRLRGRGPDRRSPNYLETQGLRLAGRASGRTVLDWPRGRFADRVGEGQLRVTAPGGVAVMTARAVARGRRGGPAAAGAGRAVQQPHAARAGAGRRRDQLHHRAGVAEPRVPATSPRPTPTSRSKAARPTATRRASSSTSGAPTGRKATGCWPAS